MQLSSSSYSSEELEYIFFGFDIQIILSNSLFLYIKSQTNSYTKVRQINLEPIRIFKIDWLKLTSPQRSQQIHNYLAQMIDNHQSTRHYLIKNKLINKQPNNFVMLGNVFKNYGSLTMMRILSRVFQFALKTYLIRTQLDEQILAHLLNMQLILGTSLHIVKSCLKPSYQKVDNNNNIIKSSMNIMTFGIVITFFCSIAIAYTQYSQYINSGKHLIYYPETIVLYAISAIFTSVAEKYMVQCTIKYQYFKLGVIEMVSFVPKTLFTLFAASTNLFSEYGILIFGVAQFVYQLCYVVIFFFMSENKSFLLQKFKIGNEDFYLDSRSKQSLKDFGWLTLLKYVLQQFEKIVLVIMDISHISSIYTLISNVGSLVVRYLYAPLNQIIFNYFSRGDHQESVQALINFIQCITYFSIIALNFGFNYSEIFLTFLYGEKWLSDQTILALRTYMVLVVFLGFNGIIEAFLFAKGKEVISQYNYFSILTTCIYLVATVAFLYGGCGASGLFLGNIVNMAMRIIVCWNLEISKYIKFNHLLQKIKPSLLFTITSVVVFVFGHKQYGYVQGLFTNIILKFLSGVALLGINLLPVLYENHVQIIHYIRTIRKSKKQ